MKNCKWTSFCLFQCNVKLSNNYFWRYRELLHAFCAVPTKVSVFFCEHCKTYILIMSCLKRQVKKVPLVPKAYYKALLLDIKKTVHEKLSVWLTWKHFIVIAEMCCLEESGTFFWVMLNFNSHILSFKHSLDNRNARRWWKKYYQLQWLTIM